MEKVSTTRQDIVKKWHYLSGLILSVFIGFHLLNQLFSFGGPDAHIALMNSFRKAYRFPPVEAILLVAALSQVITGIRLLFSPIKKTTPKKLQVYSGMYLSFFLFIHISAVMMCRLHGLDSNFWLAAVGQNYNPAVFFFLPYYFLAVSSITIHIASLHYLKTKSRWSSYLIGSVGIVAAVLIIVGFTNAFTWRTAPLPYQQLILPYFGRH